MPAWAAGAALVGVLAAGGGARAEKKKPGLFEPLPAP
jgi:hypothetical protein